MKLTVIMLRPHSIKQRAFRWQYDVVLLDTNILEKTYCNHIQGSHYTPARGTYLLNC